MLTSYHKVTSRQRHSLHSCAWFLQKLHVTQMPYGIAIHFSTNNDVQLCSLGIFGSFYETIASNGVSSGLRTGFQQTKLATCIYCFVFLFFLISLLLRLVLVHFFFVKTGPREIDHQSFAATVPPYNYNSVAKMLIIATPARQK